MNRRNRHGGTSSELLVVIAMIAALVALFMPVIALVRSVVRTTQCSAHMRHITMASLTYHEEWRQRWPEQSDWFWADAVGSYLGIDQHPSGGHYDQIAVLNCPGMRAFRLPTLWKCGYSANAHIMGSAVEHLPSVRIVDVPAESETHLFLCGSGDYSSHHQWLYGTGGFGRWHRDNTTAAFCDGSVKLRNLSTREPETGLYPHWDGRFLRPDR
jgi:hypothetical protein